MFATDVTASISQSDMFTALRKFLLMVVDVPVIQTQQNKVSVPNGDFVTMTTLGLDHKSTNRIAYSQQSSTPGEEQHRRTLIWRCQVDCYGAESASMANAIATVFRSEWGCEVLKSVGSGVTPLFATEPHQTTFINDASQYEGRWTVDLHMQVDVVVTVPRYFFDNASVQTVATDTIPE